MGLTDAKPPRPVLPLTDAAQEKVAKVLKELKLS
jgi:4-hydroxy-tetrahydrodipicolinate synthase